jgi:hypothetical protein
MPLPLSIIYKTMARLLSIVKGNGKSVGTATGTKAAAAGATAGRGPAVQRLAAVRTSAS